ncbi:MAG: family 10 glycosylhydrolase [Phormidesmis sp. RL_2_1]|nr:family 10 glycosylhydrolase [Phormidesmis sp. RL_2_1]
MIQVLRSQKASMNQHTRSDHHSKGDTKGDVLHYIYGVFIRGLLGTALSAAAIGPVMAISPQPSADTLANSPDSTSPLSAAPQSSRRSTQLAGRTIQRSEVRSIWLDRETIVTAGSREGLARVFERFKAAGINTVFVETVNAGYPIYPSQVAPEQNPLTRQWDPLQAAVDLGKAHNMEIHAWVWIFAAGNQAHNPLVGQPASYPGPILSARPDWAGYDRSGNLIIPGQTKPFLDPANPEVRQYLFDLLGEIASRYDVDGIQFDYIRYPFQDAANNRTFGYGTAARQQFQQLTGVDPIELSPQNRDQRQRYLWNQWTAFRIQQVTSFVSEASQRLRRQRPELILSAAVFADDTYKRQQEIQQDWEDWADQGLVNWIVLMSYASNTRDFEALIRPWVVESSYRSTQVIPGIRLLNLPAAAALDQLQLLGQLATSGYALFAADNLNGEMQAMLASTQGENQQAAMPSDELAIALPAANNARTVCLDSGNEPQPAILLQLKKCDGWFGCDRHSQVFTEYT